MDNELLIAAICQAYHLGKPQARAKNCKGGLLHSVWKIHTHKGFFIIKKLNPAVIGLPKSKERFRITEHICREFNKTISTLPALTIDDDPLFTCKDGTLMVFPYVEARVLSFSKITLEHIKKMGVALAKIHQANLKIKAAPKNICLSVGFLNRKNKLQQIAALSEEISDLLRSTEPLIKKIFNEYKKIETILKKQTLISHRDCDPKNVLWDKESNYYIIDWEAAGLINQTRDVLSTAIYWSMNKHYQINTTHLATFLSAYQSQQGKINKNHIEAGLYGFLGDLVGWLDFSLSRILRNPHDSHEYKLGMSEAKKTLTALPILSEQLFRLW